MDVVSIVNGTVIRHDGSYEADLIVEDGVISEIHRAGSGKQRGIVVDAESLLVLPGAIDMHFHCRAPAYPERGDFATETSAAAAGGVTSVMEMPLSNPSTFTRAVFDSRREHGERDAYVDFGLYAAPGSFNIDHIDSMVEAGAIGFKIFMTAAPPNREDEFQGLCVTNERDLLRVLETVQRYDLVSVIHAETNSLVEHFENELRAQNRNSPSDHTLSRPQIVESSAIALVAALARETETKVHIAHVSSETGVDQIRDARAHGTRLSAETCPHYLLFISDALLEHGPFAKINPPLRNESDRLAIWNGIADGTIQVIASDHSTFTLEEKNLGWQDIWLAPPGAPSIDVFYPTVLDQALQGRFTISEAVSLASTRPAQILNIYPQKGDIQVGSDADLVLFDPHVTTSVDRSRWMSKAAACDRLYTGMVQQGSIHSTYVRGQKVFSDGTLTGIKGHGRLIEPIRSERSFFPRTAAAGTT